MSNARSVLYDLLKGKPVTFLFDLYNQTQSSELKKEFGFGEKKNSEWEYHDVYKFDGSEADVIVYATSDKNYRGFIYWPAMSRARKLLVIIANVSNLRKKDSEVLESAVNKGLVTNGEKLLDDTIQSVLQ